MPRAEMEAVAVRGIVEHHASPEKECEVDVRSGGIGRRYGIKVSL